MAALGDWGGSAELYDWSLGTGRCTQQPCPEGPLAHPRKDRHSGGPRSSIPITAARAWELSNVGAWHTVLEREAQASSGSERVLGSLFHFLPPDRPWGQSRGMAGLQNMEPLNCVPRVITYHPSLR